MRRISFADTQIFRCSNYLQILCHQPEYYIPSKETLEIFQHLRCVHVIFSNKKKRITWHTWLKWKKHVLKGDGGTNNGKKHLTMTQFLGQVYHTLQKDGHHGQVLWHLQASASPESNLQLWNCLLAGAEVSPGHSTLCDWVQLPAVFVYLLVS